MAQKHGNLIKRMHTIIKVLRTFCIMGSQPNWW